MSETLLQEHMQLEVKLRPDAPGEWTHVNSGRRMWVHQQPRSGELLAQTLFSTTLRGTDCTLAELHPHDTGWVLSIRLDQQPTETVGPPARRFVKVRAAVVVTVDGNWCVQGHSDWCNSDAMGRAGDEVPGAEDIIARAYTSMRTLCCLRVPRL